MNKESYTDILYSTIQQAREGNSVWIPIGFNKIGQHVAITRSMYTIVGGLPGSGKTAFVDLAYVLNPLHWYMNNKDNTDIEFYCIYWSMERSLVYKLAKWVCLRLYILYNILIDVPTLMGWGSSKSRVPDDIYQKIVESRDFIEKIQEYVEIIPGSINPTGIYQHMKDYALKHGVIEYIPERLRDGRLIKKRIYRPDNPKRVTVVVLDHIGRLKGETIDGSYLSPQSKGLLDKMSMYNSGEFRDLFGFSPVTVVQFNRGIDSAARPAQWSKNDVDLSPLPGDFKGSSNMYEDADVAIALFNPYKFKATHYGGYHLSKFVNSKGYNRFRAVILLKNSYGIDDVSFGTLFLGECGYMIELPPASKMTDKDYERIRQI